MPWVTLVGMPIPCIDNQDEIIALVRVINVPYNNEIDGTFIERCIHYPLSVEIKKWPPFGHF